MHEMGLLYKIISSVRTAAEENHVRRIKSIELDIGELSGILPVFLQHYFIPFTQEDPLFYCAELVINSIEGTGFCGKCRKIHPITGFGMPCPGCGSMDVRIVSGREVTIRNILVETDEEENTENVYGKEQEQGYVGNQTD